MKTIKDVLDGQLKDYGVPRCDNGDKWEDYDVSRTKVLIGLAIESYEKGKEIKHLEFA